MDGGAPADFPISGATAERPPIWPTMSGVTAELSGNLGSNGGANAKFPLDGSVPQAESAQELLQNSLWEGANSAPAGSALPMEVEHGVGIEPSAPAGASFQNIVVNQTNILSEGCLFGNVTQTTLHDTRVAMETTIHVAEERHQQVIHASYHAHQQEMESVRREARATQEANVALQRAAQEANKAHPRDGVPSPTRRQRRSRAQHALA